MTRQGAIATAVALALACLSVAAVTRMASERAQPARRCGEGFVPLGPRCCGEGQQLDERQRCVGRPLGCGPEHQVTDEGCVPAEKPALVALTYVRIGPSDWEAQGVVEPREVSAGPLFLDRFELTEGAFAACAMAGACEGATDVVDAGRAAMLSLEQAAQACAWRGGRLPTDDEWTIAAMGAQGRRYPWGDTGAVCARAAFGLVTGPCARDGLGPDTVGTRPAGRSPEGLFDMAGNAPEWTLAADGTASLRGGSYASALATDLRGWRAATVSPSGARLGGVRCARDVSP